MGEKKGHPSKYFRFFFVDTWGGIFDNDKVNLVLAQ